MKSKKIISSLMALSIIGTSTFVFGGNVRAASVTSNQSVQNSKIVKNNLKSQVNVRSIIPINQKFSVYCELPVGVSSQVKDYIRNCARKNITPTSDGIRNVLTQNGVSKGVANNISFTLLDLALKTVTKDVDEVYPEDWFANIFDVQYGNSKTIILSNGNDEFCLASVKSPAKNYSIYGILTIKDMENLVENMKKYPHDKNSDYTQDYLQQIVLKSNLTQDKDMARKIGSNFYFVGQYQDTVISDLKKINENLLVLISDDNKTVIITRQPR